MTELVPRVGGRLLLIDPQGHVLLVHERSDAGDSTVWLAPGGGVEPGETPVHAAVREVYEETGIRAAVPDDAPEAKRLRRVWRSHGVTYDQVEIFFVAQVAGGLTVEPASLTPDEQQTILGSRWWSPASPVTTRTAWCNATRCGPGKSAGRSSTCCARTRRSRRR